MARFIDDFQTKDDPAAICAIAGRFRQGQFGASRGVLAVEVRSEGDYSPSAQIEIADKRADYFEAGTAVVWDVDPLAKTIAVYRATSPRQPQIFTAGQIADTEPAVPGLHVKVSDVFK